MIGSLLEDSILPENKLEQAALGLGATLSTGEVLDQGGASDHSFSQENLDSEHNLGKNKTALGTTPLQQLGAQTAYKAKKNKPSAKESSHQQLGMRRKKQRGQQPAASKLRNNLRKPRNIKEIELALMAAEEKTSLDQDTRSDLSFRFLLTFSLINQWQIATAKVSPAYQEGLASTISLEELGLRTCAADSNIFFGDQLLIMQFQGELLIGGAQLQQEDLITQLSALDLLQETIQLDHNTPVIFQNKILEYNKLEHSNSLHMPLAFYMQLLERHNLEHETATNLPQEELAPKASRQNKQVLDAKQQELYKKTVGLLLWSRACRPDTSYAVEQLSLSLENPTAQDQDQLFCLLRYLKGTMHYSLILQPWNKKSLEKARHIELLAYSSTSWTAESPTSTACLSCWGVTLATSCRHARRAWTQAAAELDAVVLAQQLASHCQSLIQGMQLDLALPDLHVFFCSLSCKLVTGRPLALQLGLSRRKRHVQLRTKDGQLQLSKVLPVKNLADGLTKNLSTASFHRLLPKLMVHTRAVESQALLTRLSREKPASFFSSSSSFFIGMVALHPQMALTTASSTDVPLQLPSLTERGKETEKDPAFPQLATEQLQKRIDSGKSFQCNQLSQNSFQSLSTQLCRYSLQSLSQQLYRNLLQSFSEQLCQTQSLSAQLYKKSLERLSEQLCKKSLASLSEQLCRSSLDSLIRQNSSKQLQPISFDQSSFEQRAFNCAALLGSTQLGHKQLQQLTRQSFQLPPVQLCQCMVQRGVSNKASHTRALRTRSSPTTLTRRSWCTRSSQDLPHQL